MYINNAIYKTIRPKGLTLPIVEGQVLTAGGAAANEDGSDAYCIVPETISNIAPTGLIYVAVGGTIDLSSDANKNVVFSDAMIKALGKDFNFVLASETPDPVPELPVVTSDDNGDVLAVVNGAWAKSPAPSSLPPYTSADKGKVLTVGEGSESVEPKWEAAGGALIVKATGVAQYSAEDGFFVNADATAAEILACFQPDTARPVYILFPQFSYDGTAASYDYSDSLSNFMMPLRQLMNNEEVTFDNYKFIFGSLGTTYFMSMMEDNV